METKNRTEAESIADIVYRGQPIIEVEPGKIYKVVDGDGEIRFLDTDMYAETPRTKFGTVNLHNAEGLIRYLDKHATTNTEIWADIQAGRIKAVIDAPGKDDAGWSRHVANLQLQLTPQWKAWAELDSRFMGQIAFAEHIEDRAEDIREPDSAHILEIAQTFQAKRGLSFESSQRLSNGEVQLGYREETSAQGGKKGDLSIPEKFVLGLQPYEGSEHYRVEAAFRYRLREAELALGFKLQRKEDILREAFTDIATQVENKAIEIGANFYHGMV